METVGLLDGHFYGGDDLRDDAFCALPTVLLWVLDAKNG